jgi:signal transduction histidine kinase
LLLLILRAGATATAATLLAVHRVTAHDNLLIAVVLAYFIVTAAAVLFWPQLARRPLCWIADMAIGFALLCVSPDWRSPFYLLALTTLALPAAALGPRRAVVVGVGWTTAFAVVAYLIGPNPLHLGNQATKETLAAHLVLPIMICLGVGYAAETVRGLASQRRRTERLAIEAERRRIAWELHDSAKQRVHAAHLLVSALADADDPATAAVVDQAIAELEAASAEMDTSLAELQEPLLGRPLDEAVRQRGEQLTLAGGPAIDVQGELRDLSSLQAAHAYRIVAEAITNAVRHAGADQVVVMLGRDAGHARIVVRDDGTGLPAVARPGATGLLAMRNRARSIKGTLDIDTDPDRPGTAVTLTFPLAVDDDA